MNIAGIRWDYFIILFGRNWSQALCNALIALAGLHLDCSANNSLMYLAWIENIGHWNNLLRGALSMILFALHIALWNSGVILNHLL